LGKTSREIRKARGKTGRKEKTGGFVLPVFFVCLKIKKTTKVCGNFDYILAL